MQTINLIQNATYLYRYTGLFNAVSDPSGLGRYIDITVIPYTDSGHTTPSQNYAALLVNYVVLQQWIPSLGAGGGGSIDYDKLRLTIAEVVEEKVFGSAKDVKKGFKKIPAIEYERIGNDMREALKSVQDELMGSGRLNADSIQKLMGMHTDFSGQMLKSHGEIFGRVGNMEQRIALLESTSKSDRESLKKELSVLLKQYSEDIGNRQSEHEKNLHKEFTDYSKKSFESLERMMQDNLSEKEVRFKFSEMPRDKREKEVELDPIIKKIMGIT